MVALAVAIFLFTFLYALLASGLTNAALKSRLETSLSSWSGMQVQSTGNVSLGFFPPTATLTAVKAVSVPPAVSVEAERLDVSFSFLSLIANKPVISEVGIDRGNIDIDAKKLSKIQRPDDGSRPPGTFRFGNTKLAVTWLEGRRDEVGELGGSFRWPELGSPAKLTATGNWNGEIVRLEASSDAPLKVLSGSESAISLQLKSAPLSLDYAGKIAFPDMFLADGKLNARAPSLNTLLDWLNIATGLPSDQGALDIEASLSHADGKFTLNDLTMAFGGIPATGMLVLDPSPATPLLSGTLAFEKADLGSLVSTFQPAAQGGADRSLDLDLRFSADAVQAASLALENAAGTIKVSGNDTFLDLGSSQIAGGECVGSLKFSGPSGKREAVVKLSVRNVMADQLGSYDTAFPALSAPMSLQLEAAGEFYNWFQFIRQAKGTLKMTVGEGVARNFSTETLAGLVSGGAVFALTETYAGLAPVVSGEVSATLSRGAAIINMADLQFTSHEVRLAGAVPLLSGGVALSGRIAPAGNLPDGLPFFVGGTWGRPFVTMGATGQ